MKTKVVSLFFLFFILFSCSNENVENDLTKNNLRGKVKSVFEISYKAEKSFGKIVKGVRSRSFSDFDIFMKFNKKGYVIERKFFKMESLDNRVEYKYDENDHIIEETAYSGDGSLIWKSVNEYDENGNLIVTNSYDSDNSIDWIYTYKYDENNHLIEEKSYKSDRSLDYKITYQYDDKGNMIEKNMYKPDGSLDYRHTKTYYEKENAVEEKIYKKSKLFWKEVNKYDEAGNRIEYQYYNSNRNLESYSTYKYDDKGNEIEFVARNSDGGISVKSINQYEYDKEGNWVKKIHIPDGKPRYILERTIEYYD